MHVCVRVRVYECVRVCARAVEAQIWIGEVDGVDRLSGDVTLALTLTPLSKPPFDTPASPTVVAFSSVVEGSDVGYVGHGTLCPCGMQTMLLMMSS
jgi:hypothetical protein